MTENDWTLSSISSSMDAISPLQNPLLCPEILDEIFKYMYPKTKSIKQFRLVCKIWNTTILSMSLPKICLIVNTTKEIKINGKRWMQDPNEFKNLCDTMNPKLARRISSFTAGVEGVFNSNIDPIRFQNFQLCAKKFGEHVQFISIKEIDIKFIHELYNYLQKYCPRVKVLEVFVIDKQGYFTNNVPMLPYANNNNLESLDIRWGDSLKSIGPVKTMLQLLLDAASNLKQITLTFDFFPNLSNNGKLESVIINRGSENFYSPPPLPIPRQPLTGLSTMLQQVSSHLTQLELNLIMFPELERNFVFALPKMPKLQSFSAIDIRRFSCGEALEKVIGPSLKRLAIDAADFRRPANYPSHVRDLILRISDQYGYPNCRVETSAGSVESLTLEGDMGDIRILSQLSSPFPGLRRLNVLSSNVTWSTTKEVETPQLYTALGVCSHLDLEHFEITFTFRHNLTLSGFIKCLSDHTELFRDKRIRTLIIKGVSISNDVTAHGAKWNNQMRKFEQALMSMLGMDRFSLVLAVGRRPRLTQWRQRLEKFVEDNQLPVQFSFRYFF